MLNSRCQRLASRFRCPECKARVALADAGPDVLACTACGRSYPVRNGTPVLLSGDSGRDLGRELASSTGLSMVQEYGAYAGSEGTAQPAWRRLVEILRPPTLLYHTNPDLRAEATERLYDHRGPETLVLNVGGGPTRFRPSEVTMNLEAFPNVDLVGDAHNQPFLDDTFDSIVCNAVLEHVHDPERVVSEMVRVLKPDGYLYAEVPYMFFFHGYPNDFRRYTREGMKRLFASLEDPDIGIVIGPVSATLQSLNLLVQLFVPRRVPYLRKIVNGCFRWVAFPFKYLDIPLLRREEAHILAGGFYAHGRKARSPVDTTSVGAS